jgi:hypothetical protein
MKKLLLACLLLVACPAIAQKAIPTKGDNIIIISTPDSTKAAYVKVAALLLEAGYTIDRSDKELLFINTKFRPAPRYNMEHAPRVTIAATANGSKISLRDAFVLPGAAAVSSIMAGQQEVVFRGGKTSTFMICWDELQKLASLYPAGNISYTHLP